MVTQRTQRYAEIAEENSNTDKNQLLSIFLILGGGFGALSAAESLLKNSTSQHEITVVSRSTLTYEDRNAPNRPVSTVREPRSKDL